MSLGFLPGFHPTRRGLLAGAACAAWTGLLSRWVLGAQRANPAAKAKSVIMIFNCGGPSHIDLWDPKPGAPEAIRGPFAPIKTSVPGIEVSELIPDLAKRMHQLALIRTVSHSHGQHNAGMYWSITGHPYEVDSTLIHPGRTEHPSFGTLVGWLAERSGLGPRGLPPYVITPYPHSDGPYITPGQYGACLGTKFDPFVLNSDPNAGSFEVRNLRRLDELGGQRLAGRMELLANLNRGGRAGVSDAFADFDAQHARAAAMLATDEARHAFDLSSEKPELREKYGRHSWGQSHLLARRLVQAGVKFVTTVNGPGITWDTHKNNFEDHKNRLVPPMQRAFVALLDDLSERGMLESTLVIWMGDFGRTPQINKDAGRDHWPDCYSMVLAGGGIKGGVVVGESDKIGAYPQTRPIRPADVHATVFRALGYDAGAMRYEMADGRPMMLSEGSVISELF